MPIANEDYPVPLILGVNGSKNWADHHLEYMKMYREIGFATFELQSFNSRNVKSTVGEQISVTTAMMILDAYKALEILTDCLLYTSPSPRDATLARKAYCC